MTKDVLVSISGLQMTMNDTEDHDNEPIEILTVGTYYFKDGKHYIFFEEVAEGLSEVTKTQIRLHGTETLEVIKKGTLNTRLVFEKDKSTKCVYKTPFGELELGICTSEICVDEKEDEIDIRAEYTMNIHCEPLADCSIRIHIQSKE